MNGSVQFFCTAVPPLLHFFFQDTARCLRKSALLYLSFMWSYFGSEAFGQQHRPCYDTLWASEGARDMIQSLTLASIGPTVYNIYYWMVWIRLALEFFCFTGVL